MLNSKCLECGHVTLTLVPGDVDCSIQGYIWTCTGAHTQETVDISLFSTQKLYPKELNATVLVSASNFDKRGQHLYSVEMFSCRNKTSPAAGATQSE